MLQLVDNFLNRITTYRLVLYYLLALFFIALVLCTFGWLPYHPISLLYSTFVLLLACWLANTVFATILKVPTNVESVYITALILALIISPPNYSGILSTFVPFLLWAAVWAMLSKYMLNIKKKHIFNPAAFAVALTSLTIHQSATWWVGSSPMFIFVLLGGLLVIRKVRRFDAVVSFVVVALFTTIALTLGSRHLLSTLTISTISSPLLFFAAIMLTEPLTMPPTRTRRILYAGFVGLLFSPEFHLGTLYFTPELALLAGNVFSYIVSPKGRYVLKLKEKNEPGTMVGDFVFATSQPLKFRPGQYMEWTLGHAWPDSRGNRRYFTIASSPTEKDLRLGVKFYPKSSTFKQQLSSLAVGDTIIASQLAGDFVLPRNPKRKLVFIAGGIGITPFRSMAKYLVDRKEQRSIVLFYSNKTADEIVYNDLFRQAEAIGLKTVYTLTDEHVPPDWTGYRGYVDREMILGEVPDFLERTFYISGSHTMVTDLKTMLHTLGVHSSSIKIDFFPGLV